MALKERDAANAKALGCSGLRSTLEEKTASGDMKKLIAENERCKRNSPLREAGRRPQGGCHPQGSGDHEAPR